MLRNSFLALFMLSTIARGDNKKMQVLLQEPVIEVGDVGSPKHSPHGLERQRPPQSSPRTLKCENLNSKICTTLPALDTIDFRHRACQPF